MGSQVRVLWRPPFLARLAFALGGLFCGDAGFSLLVQPPLFLNAFFIMKQFISTALGRLRLIGWLEGVSFLLLLGVAMPLKYLWGMPEPVRIIGMAHGVLFIVYVAAALQVTVELSWGWTRAALVVAASLVPFGTFYADTKWLRPSTVA